jgi:hypothetical protein
MHDSVPPFLLVEISSQTPHNLSRNTNCSRLVIFEDERIPQSWQNSTDENEKLSQTFKEVKI